ncbi:SGNH/GDSL hydrolase family protein [Pedobacter sp. MC2016-14]|uniref:SGNH/GDSL hydrolase family protein n=1 Tax=Pedobacter sp. MC2016-14 TaxID=2897327 RepID=UPI001E60E07B|nr:SGNH/GDSL hydrolase family protein [Pedobacter sp. MC2016-14]MCD0488196.1 SGNH/GDSL hydrolase family protein [Pedobacter sp. MC2016-14]
MIKLLKTSICAVLLTGLCFPLMAQKNATYVNAESLTIIGKSMATANVYDRADTSKYSTLPARVKQLLTNTAGVAISFTTNSTSISAKWCVTMSKAYPNLTAIANKGLDLYIKNNGKWQYAGIAKPTGVCSEGLLVDGMYNVEKECLLYLPIYDAVRKLEIGVDAKAEIKAASNPFKKRILVYGSSIVQGSGASRSGIAYPAQLSRLTGLNFINLGLSGSAKMEPEVADMVAAIDADAYILDCVPNSTPAQITERTGYLINTIRKQHPDAPIMVMQSIVREQGYWNKKTGAVVKNQNINIQKEVMTLLEKGMKNLYFITSENLIGNDHEGSVDGVHPNDLGFYRMTQQLLPQFTDILNKHGITNK